MPRDSDFAAYAAARWPALVRTLALLGGRPDAAEDVARTALARSSARWGRISRSGDVDVHVYRILLDCWSRRRWCEPPPATSEEPTDQGLLLAALEQQLDRLAPEPRLLLVLRFVAGLSAVQVAEVLDLPIGVVDERLEVALAGLDLAGLPEVRR